MSPRHDLDLPAVYEDTSFDQVQDGFGLNGPEDLIVVEHEAEAPHHDFPGQMTPLRQGIQERAETPFVLDQVAADIVKSKGWLEFGPLVDIGDPFVQCSTLQFPFKTSLQSKTKPTKKSPWKRQDTESKMHW